MALGPLIKPVSSFLKAGIKELPEKIKSSSVDNELRKKGIKAEEQQFSGVKASEGEFTTKDELLAKETARPDVFGEEKGRGTFKPYTINSATNPTYAENVYTFKGAEPNEFVSEQMPEVQNYLYHTRTSEGMLAGKPTRVVEEIQSDLFQAARKDGIDTPNVPYKKTWLKKGIEKELHKAIEGGQEQLAIPIRGGGVSQLVRDQGVQKWYETSVQNTAKKIANVNNMDFELVSEGIPWKMPEYLENNIDDILERSSRDIGGDIETKLSDLELATAGESWQDDFFAALGVKDMGDVDTAALKLPENVASMEGQGVEYAVIKFKGEQAPVKLPPQADMVDAIKTASNVTDVMFDMGVDSKYVDAAQEALGLPYPSAMSKNPEAAAAAIQKAATEFKIKNPPNLSLYSADAAAIAAAYAAFEGGQTPEQVIATGGPLSPELVKELHTAYGHDYPLEAVQAHLEEPELGDEQSTPASDAVEPDEGSWFGNAYRSLLGQEAYDPRELVSKMRVLSTQNEYLATQVAAVAGSKSAARNVEKAAEASNDRIIKMAADRGVKLTVKDGEYYAITEKGEERVTPQLWRELTSSMGELAMGMAGALQGFRTGFAAAPPVLPIPVIGGLSKPLGGAIGAITLGTAGAIAGSDFDYLHNAILLQEDVNMGVLAQRHMTVAEMSLVGELVGAGVVKAGGKSLKNIGKAMKFVKDGVFERAHKALLEDFFMTAEEATDTVHKMARVAEPQGRTMNEKRIAANMLSRAGSEEVVADAVAQNTKMSRSLSKSITTRAEDLLKTTKDMTSDNIGELISNELKAYDTLNRESFDMLKTQAANAPRANSFKFKFDDIAIKPVIESIGKGIKDTALQRAFLKHVQKINSMSSTRTLPDLIELRNMVDEFSYNKNIIKPTREGRAAITNVKNRIDKAIKFGAEHTMDNPKQWLDELKEVNKESTRVHGLRTNKLVKALSNTGVSEATIEKTIARYANAIDGTFVDVLSQLPKATREKAEGTVIDVLARKFTIGSEGGLRATQFPALAEELKSINFVSADARATKKAIMQLADVFRNDVALGQAAGKINVPAFQSALTADPVIRAKMTLSSMAFSRSRAVFPGHGARSLQLINKTAKLLENPLDAKSIKALKAEFGDTINIDPELNQLMSAYAKKQADGTAAEFVELYGNGRLLSTLKKGQKHSIASHRIMPLDQIAEVAQSKGIHPSDTEALYMVLEDMGYKAVQTGDNTFKLIGE